MNKSVLIVPILSMSALLSGCVGTGPNTEQGAVTGGVLGALAGAIIGNNSRGGDTATGALVGAATGAVAGGVIGNSVDQERGTIYGGPDRRVRTYGDPYDRTYRGGRVQTMQSSPPPAPPEVIPPQPAPNAVWVAGYWIYDGRTYTWSGGHWEIPPPMARAYVAGHWENRNGQTVYVPGYWQ